MGGSAGWMDGMDKIVVAIVMAMVTALLMDVVMIRVCS